MRVLNHAYRVSGALAALFLVLIAVLTLLQIGGRFLGVQVRDAGEFAGFAMAASSFLGLAYTLRNGRHIRVTLLVSRLNGTARQIAEAWCLLCATTAVGLFAWFSITMTWQSFDFGDLSTGMMGVPLWIPQIGMALGLVLLEIALLEECSLLIQGKRQTYDSVDSDAYTE